MSACRNPVFCIPSIDSVQRSFERMINRSTTHAIRKILRSLSGTTCASRSIIGITNTKIICRNNSVFPVRILLIAVISCGFIWLHFITAGSSTGSHRLMVYLYSVGKDILCDVIYSGERAAAKPALHCIQPLPSITFSTLMRSRLVSCKTTIKCIYLLIVHSDFLFLNSDDLVVGINEDIELRDISLVGAVPFCFSKNFCFE